MDIACGKPKGNIFFVTRLFPRWLTATVLGRSPRFFTMRTPPQDCLSVFITREWSKGKDGEAAVSSMTWFQKSHSIISAISYWLHKSSLVVWETPHRMWIPGGSTTGGHLGGCWPPYSPLGRSDECLCIRLSPHMILHCLGSPFSRLFPLLLPRLLLFRPWLP